jgi:hypothetical protein
MNDPEIIVRLNYLQHMADNAKQVSLENLNLLLSSQDSRASNFLSHYQGFAFMLEHLSYSFECIQSSTKFYFQESNEDFDYAVASMLQGNYKCAVMGLRSVFELTLLGIAFQNSPKIKFGKKDINATDHIKGRCDTPSSSDVRNYLFKFSPVANSDLLSRKKLHDQYRELSSHVHTRGKAGSRQYKSALPIPTFEPARLLDMATIFVSTVAILGIALVIQFPSLIRVANSNDEYAVSRISQMFNSEVLDRLNQIHSR